MGHTYYKLFIYLDLHLAALRFTEKIKSKFWTLERCMLNVKKSESMQKRFSRKKLSEVREEKPNKPGLSHKFELFKRKSDM